MQDHLVHVPIMVALGNNDLFPNYYFPAESSKGAHLAVSARHPDL